jgi:hypothetical protein
MKCPASAAHCDEHRVVESRKTWRAALHTRKLRASGSIVGDGVTGGEEGLRGLALGALWRAVPAGTALCVLH